VFVLAKPFQPSLIFAIKVDYQREAPLRCSTLW